MSDETGDETGELTKEASTAAGEASGPRAGTVCLVGRPNAGKSTLMNRFLEEKIAIVSDKPQTTRHRLIGIRSDDDAQIVFHDTPGIHRPLHHLNRRMMQDAGEALREADIVCLLVDTSVPFGKGDRFLLDMIARVERPRVLVLNKVDQIAKPTLLPRIEQYASGCEFAEVVPLSALTGDGCDVLLDVLKRMLPVGEPLYDPELLTVHPERFLVAERIREKVLEQTRDELPFTTAVKLERWEEEGNLVRLYASILVERSGQKKILIGRQGARIKAIGTAARKDLESFLGRRVYLDLRVRLEPDWRENQRLVADLDRDLYGNLD